MAPSPDTGKLRSGLKFRSSFRPNTDHSGEDVRGAAALRPKTSIAYENTQPKETDSQADFAAIC